MTQDETGLLGGQSYRQTDRRTYSAAAHERALQIVERLWEQMHAAHLAGDVDAYARDRAELLKAWAEVRRIARLPGGQRRA